MTVSDAFRSNLQRGNTWTPRQPERKGGDGPVGVRACGRASLAITVRESNWAVACSGWDAVRAAIRKIRDDARQSEAWALAAEALRELQADVAQQFGDVPEEEMPHVDH